MRIRPESGDDAEAIERVHRGAFPTGAEADLVRRLHADFDSEISLVAEQGGAIVGHVMLSRMAVTGEGEPIRALGLGPVGVLPGHQGAGIGGALIEGALAIARTLGEELVFVLGEPAYYERFDFTAAAAQPFASPYAGPCFMALALRPSAVLPGEGSAAYARAFPHLPAP
jgi:putative acetyltransferase